MRPVWPRARRQTRFGECAWPCTDFSWYFDILPRKQPPEPALRRPQHPHSNITHGPEQPRRVDVSRGGQKSKFRTELAAPARRQPPRHPGRNWARSGRPGDLQRGTTYICTWPAEQHIYVHGIFQICPGVPCAAAAAGFARENARHRGFRPPPVLTHRHLLLFERQGASRL